MVLRELLLTSAAVVALVVISGYSPMPEAMTDRYRAMLFMGVWKATHTSPWKLTKWLGLGSYFDYVTFINDVLAVDPSKPPASASYGHMKVSRDLLAGRPVIIYAPKDVASGELLPGLVYLHGGGWAVLSADFHDRTVHDVANCTRQVVISVDYRLAPKHPFPAPFQDCMDVTKHILRHGKDFGIDVQRIGIAGDSAGGNLAAAVALQLLSEKRGESNPSLPQLRYQALMYPALQALDFSLPSYLEDPTPLPTRSRMAGYWAVYLGLDPTQADEFADQILEHRHISPVVSSKVTKYLNRQNLPENIRHSALTASPPGPYNASLFSDLQELLVSPQVSPLVAQDLKGLPTSLMVVAQYDVLRDDGLLYAHRLREAGVKTHVHHGKGYHNDFFRAFPDYFHSKTGEKSLEALCTFIKEEA